VSGRDTVFPHQLKRDMPVKILTATPVPAPRDDDFCSSVTGEICIPHGLVCTDPEKAARCGCNRTHIGISSREWTTTVKVSATDWTTDQVVGVCMDNLVESNSVEVFGPTTSTT
jgi:hypothetical protein